MLFQVNTKEKSLSNVKSDWVPGELELEKFLVAPSDDDSAAVLSESIFGEPLLLVSNQVRTRAKKRADILALDSFGNGVIVELKRDSGNLGVETQALQYLADFSSYRGESFLSKFGGKDRDMKEIAMGFLGADAQLEDINKNSRIILVARSFDQTVFSIGEWLSSKGVAFRCVTYSPVQIGTDKFLSFSVAFDRSPSSLYQVRFTPSAREPAIYWHNIARPVDDWWRFLVKSNQIPACFEDAPGDQGEKILNRYISGDIIVAYAKGYGAVGWGEVAPGNKYRLVSVGDKADVLGGVCRHRLSVKWKATASSLDRGIPPDRIRKEFNIYHPIRTSVSMDRANGHRLIKYLTDAFEA